MPATLTFLPVINDGPRLQSRADDAMRAGHRPATAGLDRLGNPTLLLDGPHGGGEGVVADTRRAMALALPAACAMYSVARYFGFRRALGMDHFDPAYRTRPFVREGIFRWTSNGMYGFVIPVLWLPGLLALSKAALVSALFTNLYIWVHYFCTEVPDMRRMYGAAPGDA